jgi:hypothetical protein
VEVVLAVVTPRQHFQHRFPRRYTALEPLGEETDDLFGDGGERIDTGRSVGQVAILGQCRNLVAHPREDVLTLGVNRRLVEPPEPHASGQVPDDREP